MLWKARIRESARSIEKLVLAQVLTVHLTSARGIPLNADPSGVSSTLEALGFMDLIHHTHTLHIGTW